MKPPERGESVKVMRDGVLFVELLVARTEPGTDDGWHAIYGSVKRQGGPFFGPYYEPRSVYAELVTPGTVRMLSTGERLRAAPREPAQ